MARGLSKIKKKIVSSTRVAAPEDSSGNRGGGILENSTAQRRLPIPITPASSSSSSSSSPPRSSCSSSSSSPLVPLPVTPTAANVRDNQQEEKSELESFIAEQRAFNQRVLSTLVSTDNVNGIPSRAKKERLPLKLTESVRAVYKEMEEAVLEDEQTLAWDFEKKFNSTENTCVNNEILRGVRSTETTFSAAQLRAAIRTHFKTKKCKWSMDKNKTSKSYLKSQRARSRLNTKRLKRQKALKDSMSFSDESKAKISEVLTNCYMSSDESMSESSDQETEDHSDSDENSPPQKSKVKVLVLKKLPWRSVELTNTLYKLDKKVARKRTPKGQSMVMERRQGPASSRRAPENAPAWAIA